MAARLYRGIFYLFLIWIPIPLGSARPLFWAINAVICLVVFALLVADEFSEARARSSPRRLMATLLAFTTIPLAWMLVQAISITPGFLHAAEWDALGPEGIAASGAISIDPGATYAAACCFVTMALAGIVAARIAANPRRANRLLVVVLLSTGLVAAWGLAALALGVPQTILGGDGPGSVLTSFFVNRNSAATYIALGLVTAVAFLARRLVDTASDAGVAVAIIDFPRRAGLHVILVAFFAVALLATASRAGVLSGFLGAMVVFFIGTRGAPASTRVAIGGGMFVLAAVLLLLGETSALFFSRLASGDIDADARWDIFGDTVDAILARPLTGFGAGTFPTLFTQFHGEDLAGTGIVLQAHNTYLETAAELGLPFTVLSILGLAILGVRCFRRAWSGDDPVPASLAAAGAVTVVAVHSLFDFSLQIQAIGILFAVILGAGIAAPLRLSLRHPVHEMEVTIASPPRRYESFNVDPSAPR